MNYFISDFVNYVLKNNQDLKDICIVTPNKRTGLFIKKHLSQRINKPAIAPEITTIKDVFVSNSEIVEAEEISLLFILHKTFRKYIKTTQDFDDFYYWGEIILNDFDSIDKYLVNTDKLFSNLREIKEIDSLFDKYDEKELEIIKKFWQNINQAKISEHKQNFLELWDKMNLVYKDFKKILFEESIGYEGMIYSDVINNIEKSVFEKKLYYFVGFNALNRCEYELFKVLEKQNKARFFWDADKYYIDDKIQEAGFFIRKNIKDFPNPDGFEISDNIKASNKKIDVIVAPSEIAQTKLVPDILANWKKQNDFDPEKTAIVLGDENLLIPLMYSVPDIIENYNISMGHPVKNSQAFSFINHLCALQKNINTRNENKYFFYKNVITLLKHPYLSELYKQDCINTEKEIVDNNMILIEDYILHKNNLFKTIFTFKNSDVREFSEYLAHIGDEILLSISLNENFRLESEFLRRICLRLNTISDTIISKKIIINDLNTFYRLIFKSLGSLNVPFEGEPLKGMQVLGFLETRALDFDRIIMLSMNEGHFPKKSNPQSIIPYNLRKFFGLPSVEYQDSIYAYYFYRLLQRASDIKIIYSAHAQDGKGEASRFISQLDYELKNIKTTHTAYRIRTSRPKTIKVKKTDEIIQKIKKHLQNGVSPSAINTYLNCTLMYYLKYIEKITDPDKLEEKDDAAYFGLIFHESMKLLYDKLPKSILSEKNLIQIDKEETIKEAIEKAIISVRNIKNEKLKNFYLNNLLTDVVYKYVKLMLEYDKKHLPFSIIGLETKENFILQLNSNNQTINCRIEGIIDRIDFKDGIYRVLDYKTGNVKLSISNIGALFTEERKTELNGITQTLIYALMYNKTHNTHACPGLINVTELFSGMDYKLVINKTEVTGEETDLINEFSELLKSKLEELIDENTDFFQTEKSDNCKYCDYKRICER